MMASTRLRRWLGVGEGLLVAAERRFFRAYDRGGGADPRALVIPVDFFARPPVQGHLVAWLEGRGELDLAGLEAEWRRTDGHRERELFFRNLAHFFSLL